MVCGECGSLVPDTERSVHDNWHEGLHQMRAQAVGPMGPPGVPGPAGAGLDWGSLEITEELARQLLRRMLEIQQEE